MNARPKSGDDRQNRYLRKLYGDAQAPIISAKITALQEKYGNAAKQNSDAALLTEKDVLLITYGDTLTHNTAPPLKVFHRFYREYLQGIFDLVHILPFHPYSSDDGFSVIDYFAVRDDLGSWDDIGDLGNDCRVMADAVINHTSSQSEWFTKYLDRDPRFSDFYIDCDPESDTSSVVRPRTSPLLTRFHDSGGTARYVWTTFSPDQVDLNFRNPDVLVAVIDVLFFLISKGPRLLRLDAVTYLWKEPGTSSANLPETHVLIKIMRQAVSSLCSEVVVVTETNVPHRENVAYFGDGRDEAHMVYNFALPPLIAYSLIAGDGRHLSDWASHLSTPSDEVCFLNFTASHDGVGVRPVEEILTDGELQTLVDATLASKGMVSYRTLSDGEERPYELNCTFLDLISRETEDVASTVSRFVTSQAIVLAMPGVPAIYIQSLLGTRNDLQGVERSGRARSINRSRHDYSDVVTALSRTESLEARIFERLTHLIRMRRQQDAFDPYAPFEVLDHGDSIFAIRRGDPMSGATITCINNLTDKDVLLEISDVVSGQELLGGANVPAGKHLFPPYAVWWLLADKQ